MDNDLELMAAPAPETRCETLFRVSQAVAAHGDPKELFGVLVNELHRVVQFDFIGVSLRDKNSDTFQNYFIDMVSRSELVPEQELAPEETLTLCVYERQEPLLRSTKEMEPCYGRLQAILKRLSILSICALPLTTAHRKLGAITFGSKQVDTYSPGEIRFVSPTQARVRGARAGTAMQKRNQGTEKPNTQQHKRKDDKPVWAV